MAKIIEVYAYLWIPYALIVYAIYIYEFRLILANHGKSKMRNYRINAEKIYSMRWSRAYKNVVLVVAYLIPLILTVLLFIVHEAFYGWCLGLFTILSFLHSNVLAYRLNNALAVLGTQHKVPQIFSRLDILEMAFSEILTVVLLFTISLGIA